MAWIKEEDMRAIRQQADIVDIVSNYITVTKKGKEYRAVCPFHDDHDPSLHISPDKQIFKCFVCGAGGDVFGFVRKIENISFPEAVVKVAELINYPLTLTSDSFQKKEIPHQADYDILHEYAQFTNYELFSAEGALALDYLHKRKFTDEIIKEFTLGYAPEAFRSTHYFEAKHISSEKTQELGLTSKQNFPFFHERIMIPIQDVSGNVVGFTARRLSDQSDEPKYINTTQTPIYEKGNLIFNYHRAKANVRKANRVILVEGAMDVFGFEKAGIHEAIACLGTALTQEQIRMIQQLRVPVVVNYDNDRAGKAATYKFGKMAMKEGISFSIVKNNLGKDPDEIFITYGKEELQASVEKTISYVEFLFDYLSTKYNLENYDDKKKYAMEISEAVQNTCNEFEKASYLETLKKKTGFDFTHVQTDSSYRTRSPKKYKKPVYLPLPQEGRKQAEYIALWTILHSKRASQKFKEEIGFFKDETCDALSLYIYDQYRLADQIDVDTLFASIYEEDVRNLLATLLMNPFDLDPLNEEFFNDSLMKIRECTIQEQIDFLNQQIEKLSDPVQKVKIASKKQELILQRNRIHNRKEG